MTRQQAAASQPPENLPCPGRISNPACLVYQADR